MKENLLQQTELTTQELEIDQPERDSKICLKYLEITECIWITLLLCMFETN